MKKSPLIVFFIFLLATLVLRLPTLFVGYFNPDETWYATVAQRILEGKIFYIDIVDHKLPLMYYIYTIFVAIGKWKAIYVAHAFIILIIAATAQTIFFIVKKISINVIPANAGIRNDLIQMDPCFRRDDKQDRDDNLKVGNLAPILAGIFYIISTSCGKPSDVYAANSELIFNLPLSLHILLFIKAIKLTTDCHVPWPPEGRRPRGSLAMTPLLLLSGFLAGIAVLIKYQAFMPLAGTVLYSLFICRGQIKEKILRTLALAIGSALPVMFFALYYFKTGILNEAIYWAFGFNAIYMSGHEEGFAWLNRFYKQVLYMIGIEQLALWILPLIYIFIRKKVSKLIPNHNLLIYLWLLFSAIAIFPGGYFSGHYFIELLPPLCIVAGFAAVSLNLFTTTPRLLRVAWVLLLIVPAIQTWVWGMQYKNHYSEVETYEYRNLIKYLKENTNPEDKIETWGKFNGVQFLSERANASRFINKKLLTGSFKSNKLISIPEKHWEWFMSDMDKIKPKWFIDFSMIDMPNAPLAKYFRLTKYLSDNYIMERNLGDVVIYRRK